MESLNRFAPAGTVRDALWGTLVRIYSARLANPNKVWVRTYSDSTNQSPTTQYFGTNNERFDGVVSGERREFDDSWAKMHQT
jgi:hypothetical protein